MPTPGLNMKLPLESLFHSPSNYSKLCIFGYLCFPWLVSYVHNKLLPKSQPCVFLGYSSSQSVYLCYNFKTKKLYTSRHIHFVEKFFLILYKEEKIKWSYVIKCTKVNNLWSNRTWLIKISRWIINHWTNILMDWCVTYYLIKSLKIVSKLLENIRVTNDFWKYKTDKWLSSKSTI